MNDVADELCRYVGQLHGCSALHIGSEVVEEFSEGQPVWQGVVHVFEVAGHPETTRAYAWSSPIEGSAKRRFFAVLHVPPVISAVEAVRAAIVAEHRDSTDG